MSLLIGIKQTHASGAYHGAEGFEGFSMDGTVFNVLKEGTYDELFTFVKEARETAEKAKKEIRRLEDKIDESSNMPDAEYLELARQLCENGLKTTILEYSKLIIVEGVIV